MSPLNPPPAAATHEVVTALRTARRRRRLGDTHWGDLAYRVYTTALTCIVVAMMLSGWIGDEALDDPGVAQLTRSGPAWAGVVLAVAVLAMVRSGSRGGPIALEATDVHHLLLSPADRTATLRRPSIDVVGYGTLTGIVAVALVASLMSQRLPGSNAAWLACGALFGGVLATASLGAAMLTCSRRLPRALPLMVASLLLVWAVADVSWDFDGVPTAPTTYAGRILFWPLAPADQGLLWVAVAIAAAVGGAALIGGLSIEAARRRTQLVGQLRFAVTLQDLRSVVLLRRQLASELPRNRRWFPVPRWFARRLPVPARDLQSVAHWPAVRILRVLVLGAAAGLAVRGMWSGTTPLIAVAGIATFIAALDATEGLSQDIDHPTLRDSFPVAAGRIHLLHLAAPCVVMVVAGGVGMLTAWVVDPAPEVLSVGPIVVHPWSP